MCPVVEIPGFTYPVKEYYMGDVMSLLGYEGDNKWWENDTGANSRARGDGVGGGDSSHANAAVDSGSNPLTRNHRIDYSTVARLIATISQPGGGGVVHDDGAVLVFLPGVGEIRRLSNELNRLDSGGTMWILSCHGSLSAEEQRRVFSRPPSGQRKIVLATNVAETSITIDDVTVVVDCGKVKETRYDTLSQMSCLIETWASVASCDQRRGRAGRVSKGVCFRMFPRFYLKYMEPYTIPEIMRVPLASLCLQVGCACCVGRRLDRWCLCG